MYDSDTANMVGGNDLRSLTQGNQVPLSSGRWEESSLVLFFCKDCESEQNLIVN